MMNAKILQKCLDELKKDIPDLSYLRGTLETLIEMDGGIEIPGIVPKILTPLPAMFGSKQINASDMSSEDQEYHIRMSGGPVASMRDDG